MIENGNKSDITEKRYHREIYLSDPRKRVMTNVKAYQNFCQKGSACNEDVTVKDVAFTDAPPSKTRIGYESI